MEHRFSEVPPLKQQRSTFDRSHGLKTTFDSGYLVPIFWDEALPGDTFNLKLHTLARLSTPKVPIMDNIKMSFFFFAVPNRLLWQNWKPFMGEKITPDDTTEYLNPVVDVKDAVPGDLADYFGLPIKGDGTGFTNALNVNALPFRAYNLIWNEWFRDQNLQDPVEVETGDSDDYTNYALLRRGKRHDYFTSCLPWTQKGDAVSIPVSGYAPVHAQAYGQWEIRKASAPYNVVAGAPTDLQADTNGQLHMAGNYNVALDPKLNLIADVSSATIGSINDLRQAFQIQKMLERDARSGTRYIEVIKAHFGVISPDARMQRPEYLGGGVVPINISQVPQTSESGTTPQGNMAAYAISKSDGQVGFTSSFTEHCTIIGLVSVNADLSYQQGLERMWSRQTRYDYYWPSLATLGEQAVLNKEIYYGDSALNDDQPFGYQERYAEYRYKPSRITGLFRSTATSSLDMWHLAQEFTSLPELGADFIQDNPPIDRVIAVPSEPQIIFDSYVEYKCARPIPVFGVPGMIDHF